MKNPLGHKIIRMSIFSSRWLQAPLYIGLIIAQVVYVYKFLEEVVELVLHAGIKTEPEIMMLVLSLIDVVMISNLLIMVIIGGYETFVSRLRLENHPDIPEWLDHVNASTMKIKLAMALIGISSIHLLKTFIEVNNPVANLKDSAIMWQVIIHVTFLVSAIALAYTAKIADSLHSVNHH
ncbi:MAG: TIGR00645 family protein [Proteobacteria bacterium]|nr:TIGR00645 family protein [Pseudomonadota bacterium]